MPHSRKNVFLEDGIMNIRALSYSLLLATVVAAPLAQAQAGGGYYANGARSASYGGYTQRIAQRAPLEGYDYARVVDVQPIVRIVTTRVPHEECWEEEIWIEQRGHSRGVAGATIAGGLLGGVIGRQFGGGSGRDAMTVVGTLVGSAVASESARARQRGTSGYYDTVQRCETSDIVREEERIDGYRVTYVYNGREYLTETRNDPGERIRVRVTVSPVTGR
jgi:uncharacterized protein YcfJ